MVGENATKPFTAPKYDHYTAPGVFTKPDQKRNKRQAEPNEANDEGEEMFDLKIIHELVSEEFCQFCVVIVGFLLYKFY